MSNPWVPVSNAPDWWFSDADLNFQNDDNSPVLFSGQGGQALVFRGQPVSTNPWTQVTED